MKNGTVIRKLIVNQHLQYSNCHHKYKLKIIKFWAILQKQEKVNFILNTELLKTDKLSFIDILRY